MSALRLSENLMPLLMHIDPILATAEQFGLGEKVDVSLVDHEAVFIRSAQQNWQVVFNAHHQDQSSDVLLRVLDQWLAPYPSLDEIKQKVLNEPQLVVSGLPVADGFVDLWYHNGKVEMAFCHHLGANEPHRAMLLAALALDYPLQDACVLARAYARRYLDPDRDRLLHWPDCLTLFPRVVTRAHEQALTLLGEQSSPVCFEPVNREDFTLYAVVDSATWIDKVLSCGVTTAQLRVKESATTDLTAQISQAVNSGHTYHSQVFINDYWQQAIEAEAFGVHLGQEDLDTADLTMIAQAQLRLGISTHGYYEILRAIELKPSYIALGHVFATTTKEMESSPQGVVRLALYQKLLTGVVPTVAIGGIDLTNIEQVLRCEVDSVAVVRAITQAKNVEEAIKRLKEKIDQYRGGLDDATVN